VQERLPEGDEYRHLKLGGLPRLVFKNFEDTIYPRARAAAEQLDSVVRRGMCDHARRSYYP
jgi:hypothetical protein